MSEASRAPAGVDIILEGHSLSKRFGGRGGFFESSPVVHAVNDVSLAIRKGETFAIVGESGCGKSTLGRLLLRLLEPSEGEILYQGQDITRLGAKEMRRLRRDLQIIFQDPFASLNPRMTVGAIIAEPIRLHGLARGREVNARVAELLRTVGLRPEYADRYPHEFSGGQRQRIGIARALAGEPKLIIGDEPVSALDVSIQAQVINLLEDLKGRFGLTLVIVAHDLAVIRHMSDRVAVMYLGEIVELSDVDPLYEKPLHPYTQALLQAIPSPVPQGRTERQLLQGDVPNPTALPSGCRFHTRCPHARPRCSEEHPPLEPVGEGRSVACHFWREIQAAAEHPGDPPLASATLDMRLELYRTYQTRKAEQAAPHHNPTGGQP
ncbi:oligopeptide/dipeptide ABC transporter ATP-binding protein [Aquamicrobium sp. LC103]|uniref:ABC transporter ATP-binding protein n=1 Tax=Aquamicrobium sp. LC103 TaxID=1120658 RepID=UPI00063E96EB|nr:oligopeptide/dipeptide ABC transporter ATP-binding protein [Aquamicrobium sp. LC103]TKT69689.1 ATP-binding cassette domain-containing protein [Aquamicrobium sp. LC103]